MSSSLANNKDIVWGLEVSCYTEIHIVCDSQDL